MGKKTKEYNEDNIDTDNTNRPKQPIIIPNKNDKSEDILNYNRMKPTNISLTICSSGLS